MSERVFEPSIPWLYSSALRTDGTVGERGDDALVRSENRHATYSNAKHLGDAKISLFQRAEAVDRPPRDKPTPDLEDQQAGLRDIVLGQVSQADSHVTQTTSDGAQLSNKVALVTGAARAQGRSHAVALANEGADIIAVDIASDIDSIPYALGTKEELEETAQLVERAGRRVAAYIADVRQLSGLQACVQSGIAELGDIDIVVANAGVMAAGKTDPEDQQVFRDIVETNLFGVWNTIVATVPSIIRKGQGGSIILTSSTQGLAGRGGDGSAAVFAYAASKHGIVGLMRSAAHAYAKHNIRVNTVHPTGVATPMVINDHTVQYFQKDPEAATKLATNLLPVPLVEAQDVTNAVIWLASDKARYVTGVTLPVDAGFAAM